MIKSLFDEEDAVEYRDLKEKSASEKNSESEIEVSNKTEKPIEPNVANDKETRDIKHTDVPFGGFDSVSKAETARSTGLAFSAGVSLFASVVFMMLLGWLVDLFFGATPWGIVGGIIIGAVVGFVQFFRTTSQILNPSKSDFEKTSLFLNDDDENIK